ncbi:hypothetical protein RND81_13G070000 [Saponaria officinalis]|uniref:RRM domain-containing protein n=1 Tax=Saponaria officinalis TaxID=3572 RepID=A0AAW1GY01_SAPOF
MQQSRTIKVENLSDLANQREIHDFFSFSGDIDHIEIQRDSGQSRTAFVTFREEQALEIALLLSGATLVDRIVTISLVENYAIKLETELSIVENDTSTAHLEDVSRNAEVKSGRVNVSKAQEVVSSIISKGSAIGQDAVNKAKAFDEKHQFRATASAKATSFDKRVGLTEKLALGISVVNERVKSVDQRLHVSDKTMAAIFAAERKLNDTGSAVKSHRYVTAGAAWFDGAFSKVAKAGSVAGTKTRQKFNTALSNLTSKDPIPA